MEDVPVADPRKETSASKASLSEISIYKILSAVNTLIKLINNIMGIRYKVIIL
jgi:hypothetical protein